MSVVHLWDLPQLLAVGLNLLLGQLYFSDYATYIAACKFHGFYSKTTKESEEVDSGGFIPRGVEGRVGVLERVLPCSLGCFMLIRRDLFDSRVTGAGIQGDGGRSDVICWAA